MDTSSQRGSPSKKRFVSSEAKDTTGASVVSSEAKDTTGASVRLFVVLCSAFVPRGSAVFEIVF